MIMLYIAFLILFVGPLLTNQQGCIENEPRISQTDDADFLEYCVHGVWRRLCTGSGAGYNINEATVACRQLGYRGYRFHAGVCSQLTPSGYFSFRGTCSGDERTIEECGGVKILTSREECKSNNCQNSGRSFGHLGCDNTGCNTDDFRLVDGVSNRSGRVEVCTDGAWGTVCNNNQQYIQQIAHKVCTIITGTEASGQIISPPSGFVPIHTCTLASNGELKFEKATADTLCQHSMDLGVYCVVEEDNELATNASIISPSPTSTEDNLVIPMLGLSTGVLGILSISASIALILTCIRNNTRRRYNRLGFETTRMSDSANMSSNEHERAQNLYNSSN